MKRIKINKNFIFVFRLIIGFVFIYASIYKLANPDDFAKNIANYKILPFFLINIVAIILPWMEIILGLFIIFGLFIKASSYMISVIMTVFTLLVLLTILRGIDISCGCFSSDLNSSPIGWQKFIENVLLTMISLVIYYSNETFLSAERYFKTNKIF